MHIAKSYDQLPNKKFIGQIRPNKKLDKKKDFVIAPILTFREHNRKKRIMASLSYHNYGYLNVNPI